MGASQRRVRRLLQQLPAPCELPGHRDRHPSRPATRGVDRCRLRAHRVRPGAVRVAGAGQRQERARRSLVRDTRGTAAGHQLLRSPEPLGPDDDRDGLPRVAARPPPSGHAAAAGVCLRHRRLDGGDRALRRRLSRGSPAERLVHDRGRPRRRAHVRRSGALAACHRDGGPGRRGDPVLGHRNDRGGHLFAVLPARRRTHAPHRRDLRERRVVPSDVPRGRAEGGVLRPGLPLVPRSHVRESADHRRGIGDRRLRGARARCGSDRRGRDRPRHSGHRPITAP